MSPRVCVCACVLLCSLMAEGLPRGPFVPPEADDPMEYQVANEIDTGHFPQDYQYLSQETDSADSLLEELMYMRDDPSLESNRNQWDPTQPLYLLPAKRMLSGLLSSEEETKLPKPQTAADGQRPLAVKQPRWKNKKGRGRQMLCYFKLCAFRTHA